MVNFLDIVKEFNKNSFQYKNSHYRVKLTGDPDMTMTGVWFLFSYNCYKILVCQELGGELPVAR